MRKYLLGLWLTAFVALGVNADESAPGQSEDPAPESSAPESSAAESPEAEPPSATEEEADADIRQIEQGVSGATEVKEFIPDKPLSADKAIALPSDI